MEAPCTNSQTSSCTSPARLYFTGSVLLWMHEILVEGKTAIEFRSAEVLSSPDDV